MLQLRPIVVLREYFRVKTECLVVEFFPDMYKYDIRCILTYFATLPYIMLSKHQTPLTSAGETTDYTGARNNKSTAITFA